MAENQISGTTLVAFTSLLLLSSIATLPAQNGCILKKEKDDIRVYSCPSDSSRLNFIRAEFVVNATIEEYLRAAFDVAGFKEWHYNEINQRILSKVNDNELIYYAQVKAPFPVSNRDLVLHLKATQDLNSKVVHLTIECLPTYIPKVEDLVRVPRSFSRMTLTPITQSKLKAEYLLHVDPGGQVPAWLSNAFSTQGPYETFRRLIEKLSTQHQLRKH